MMDMWIQSEGHIRPVAPSRRLPVLAVIMLVAAGLLAGLMLMLQSPRASLAAPAQADTQARRPAEAAAGDLAVTKTHTPLSGRTSGVYHITISNIKDGPITSTIYLTDTLPSQLTYTGYAWDSNGVCGESSDIVTCTYTPSAPITAGTSLPVLTISVTNATVASVLFTNTVTINSSEDISATNNTATDGTRADLSIHKVTSNSTPREGSVVTFTVTLVNNGLDDTTNVTVNDLLPSQLTYLSSTTSKGTYTSGTGVWNIGPMTVAETAQLTLTVRVKSGTGNSNINNTAQITSSGLPDPNSANNTSTVTLGVTPGAELIVTKSDLCDTVTAGDSITYSVRITNAGTIAANNILITDVLPNYLTYVSDSLTGQSGVTHTINSKTHVWGLSSIGFNESRSFNIRVGVASPLPGGTTSVVNSIQARTKSNEANLTNNEGLDSNTVINSPQFSILSMSVTPVEARVGANFTFNIQVRNSGDRPLNNVVIKDTFSTLLNISSVSKTKGISSIDYSARTVTVDVGTLSVNETVTVNIVASVNSNATSTVTQSNSATVTFKHGCYTYSRSTNSVSYRLLGSSSLPGTGGVEPGTGNPVEAPTRGAWAALLSAGLLALSGSVALFFALRMRSTGSEWSAWTMRMGAFLLIVAVLFGLAAWGLRRGQSLPGPAAILAGLTEAPTGEMIPAQPQPGEGTGEVSFQDHETLPDYPIPAPPANPTPLPEQAEPDSSPPVRLMIPDLALDAEVKYVPYDGFTWLIQGLQWELAWMGDTSWPGLGSNTGIAGHVTLRNGTDGPFRNLEILKPGSKVVVLTEKNAYTYAVKEQKIVNDTDFGVLQDSEMPQLTLITCAGWDPAMRLYLQRLIVVAELQEIEPLAVPVSSNWP